MNKHLIFPLLLLLGSITVYGQNSADPELVFPEQKGWNEVKEGDTIKFQLKVSDQDTIQYTYDIAQGALRGMVLEDDGRFFWQPSYSLVDSASQKRSYPVVITAKNLKGDQLRKKIDLEVINASQEPEKQALASNNNASGNAGDANQPSSGSKSSENSGQTNQAGNVQDQPAVQDASPIRLVMPYGDDWKQIEEDDTLNAEIRARGGADQNYHFNLVKGNHIEGLEFDSLGNFRWAPGYDFVGRLENERMIQVIFEVRNDSFQVAREQVDLTVSHVNRSPEISDLKTFYVEYNTTNTYQIESYAVNDPDGDPVIFKPVINEMPEGAKLSENGKFTWSPSITQFNELKQDPIEMPFIAEDQPHNAQTRGGFMIKATSRDLPPEISMIPNAKEVTIQEDETLNLKFYLTDPNGDDNITSFSFISDEGGVPEDALVKNSNTQYEFVWEPGYEFVKQPGDSLSFNINFFVLDRSNKRDEKSLEITVAHAENLPRKDTIRYNQYKEAVVRAWNLIKQLEEKENELKKKFRKVKRGKRYRAITDASLGAITGLAPVFIEEKKPSNYVTGIGGTASATLGTLEATDLIGTPPSSIQEKIGKIIQKRQNIQTQGDIFASTYSLKSNRRQASFKDDLANFLSIMKLDDLASLELDAGWKNPEKPTYENISKTFQNFSPQKN